MNTKIGPALEVAVSDHQGRYGIEIMINSLFDDGTCLWVIVNGINKYVTEMTEETQENHVDDIGDGTGKLVAEARPKHQCRLLLQWLRYHTTCVSGSSNHVSSTEAVSKCKKR